MKLKEISVENTNPSPERNVRENRSQLEAELAIIGGTMYSITHHTKILHTTAGTEYATTSTLHYTIARNRVLETAVAA